MFFDSIEDKEKIPLIANLTFNTTSHGWPGPYGLPLQGLTVRLEEQYSSSTIPKNWEQAAKTGSVMIAININGCQTQSYSMSQMVKVAESISGYSSHLYFHIKKAFTGGVKCRRDYSGSCHCLLTALPPTLHWKNELTFDWIFFQRTTRRSKSNVSEKHA